jgi:hypothetical protein
MRTALEIVAREWPWALLGVTVSYWNRRFWRWLDNRKVDR